MSGICRAFEEEIIVSIMRKIVKGGGGINYMIEYNSTNVGS
jgi:hypothetical protein